MERRLLATVDAKPASLACFPMAQVFVNRVRQGCARPVMAKLPANFAHQVLPRGTMPNIVRIVPGALTQPPGMLLADHVSPVVISATLDKPSAKCVLQASQLMRTAPLATDVRQAPLARTRSRVARPVVALPHPTSSKRTVFLPGRSLQAQWCSHSLRHSSCGCCRS